MVGPNYFNGLSVFFFVTVSYKSHALPVSDQLYYCCCMCRVAMLSTVLVGSQTVPHNDLFVAAAAYTLTLSQSFLPARLCSVRSPHVYIGISASGG